MQAMPTAKPTGQMVGVGSWEVRLTLVRIHVVARDSIGLSEPASTT